VGIQLVTLYATRVRDLLNAHFAVRHCAAVHVMTLLTEEHVPGMIVGLAARNAQAGWFRFRHWFNFLSRGTTVKPQSTAGVVVSE
jgi:hypothetical protein